MKKGLIWLYDDQIDLAKRYVGKLKRMGVNEHFNIVPMESTPFLNEMNELRERQIKHRDVEGWDYSSDIDRVDILIVDFDIWEKATVSPFLTGESVAYLTRCFSKCKLIIGYRVGKNMFDLSLKGNLESYVDLSVRDNELHNSGLWGKTREEYRPWQWPELRGCLKLFERKVRNVKRNLKTSIFSFLKIPPEVVRLFSRGASSFIGGENPAATTFKEFVVNYGNGLKERDKIDTNNNEMIARIATARISKWLEQSVLPGQDILVDSPHLVYRYPSLLKRKQPDIDDWNKTTTFGAIENLGMYHQKIRKFKFKKEYWLSRPAWFWKGISEFKKIEEVSEPWGRKPTKYIFCEDSSRFYEREECKEFIADLESPYNRRFVRRFRSVEYAPEVRFLI